MAGWREGICSDGGMVQITTTRQEEVGDGGVKFRWRVFDKTFIPALHKIHKILTLFQSL